MAQPGAQPDEQEEDGRAHVRLTVLHVRRNGAPEEARDETPFAKNRMCETTEPSVAPLSQVSMRLG